MRSWGWRQGRGRRADTVYLKPKKKVPAPAAGQPSPPPRQLFLKFGSVPASWAHQGAATESKGLAYTDQPQVGSPSPASRGGIGPAWPLPTGHMEIDSVYLGF